MNANIAKVENGYTVTSWADHDKTWVFNTLDEAFVKAKEILETKATSYPAGGTGQVGINTASATWSTPTASTNTEATDKTDAE